MSKFMNRVDVDQRLHLANQEKQNKLMNFDLGSIVQLPQRRLFIYSQSYLFVFFGNSIK